MEATLTPNVIELEVDPGETIERTLTLSYKNGPPITAVVNRFSFRQLPDGAFDLSPVQPLEKGQLWSSAAWVTTPTETIHLSPGKEILLKVSVTVPEETEPGEHHSFLTVEFPALAGNEGISVMPRLGARLYITVRGENRQQADDVSVAFENLGPLGLPGPVAISLSFINKGTLHMDGSGKIKLQERITGATRELAFPTRRVLPDEEARLSTTLSSSGALIPLYLYHGRFELADSAVSAALPTEEFDMWLVDWYVLAAWIAAVLGVWTLWTSVTARAIKRRLRRAITAFLHE